MRSIATDGITARFVGLSVCPSVCLPVGHARETCKSGQTDRDAVRDIESGWPYRNHVLDGVQISHPTGQFGGERGGPL